MDHDVFLVAQAKFGSSIKSNRYFSMFLEASIRRMSHFCVDGVDSPDERSLWMFFLVAILLLSR
jgi:hypothetical protein